MRRDQRSQSYVVRSRDFLPNRREEAIEGPCRYRTTEEYDFPEGQFSASNQRDPAMERYWLSSSSHQWTSPSLFSGHRVEDDGERGDLVEALGIVRWLGGSLLPLVVSWRGGQATSISYSLMSLYGENCSGAARCFLFGAGRRGTRRRRESWRDMQRRRRRRRMRRRKVLVGRDSVGVLSSSLRIRFLWWWCWRLRPDTVYCGSQGWWGSLRRGCRRPHAGRSSTRLLSCVCSWQVPFGQV